MKPEVLSQKDFPNILNTENFQHRKGYFIIEADPIMTENFIVNVLEQYQLVEFRSGGEIKLRDVMFWHAALKQGMLKILVYDVHNKIVIQKMHDIERPNNYSDWFLISEDYFGDDMLEFQF